MRGSLIKEMNFKVQSNDAYHNGLNFHTLIFGLDNMPKEKYV